MNFTNSTPPRISFPPPRFGALDQAEIEAALTITDLIGEQSWRQITKQFVWILVSQGIVVTICRARPLAPSRSFQGRGSLSLDKSSQYASS